MADIKSKSQMKRISVQNPAKAAEVLQSLQEENARLRAQLATARKELKAAQMDMRPGMSRDESISARQRIEAVIEVLDGDTEGRDGKV